MKKIIDICFIFMFCSALNAQSLSKKDMFSVILNNFQTAFPNATDVKWKKKDDQYKVEFEIGVWKNDHSAWYDLEGKLLRHEEEITKKNLPQKILEDLKKNYRWYWISEIEKITHENQTTYKVELDSFTKEWEIYYDENGNMLKKIRD